MNDRFLFYVCFKVDILRICNVNVELCGNSVKSKGYLWEYLINVKVPSVLEMKTLGLGIDSTRESVDG